MATRFELQEPTDKCHIMMTKNIGKEKTNIDIRVESENKLVVYENGRRIRSMTAQQVCDQLAEQTL